MKVKGSTFFLSTLLVCGLAVGFAQQLDVDRELEEAKALYREAKFAQAIAKLQSTIGRLEQLRDLQARKIQLSDAHLHLALSYVALNDPSAAKESLKQMLRADRNRRLDPDVYAPKVIELFEEAKREVAAEPAAAATPPPSATAKKGGSKTPLILLGAAAAAGGGLALAKGGGGSTGAASAATPTTTPAPTVSGPDDIVFLGSTPPPGTVSVSTTRVLTVRATLVYSRSGNYQLFFAVDSPGHPAFSGRECLSGTSQPFTLTAGRPQTVEIPGPTGPSIAQLFESQGCPLPVTVTGLTITLYEPATATFLPLRRDFPVTYSFVR